MCEKNNVFFYFVFYKGDLYSVAYGKEQLESIFLDLKFWAGRDFDSRLCHTFELLPCRAKYLFGFLREYLPFDKENVPPNLDFVRKKLFDILSDFEIGNYIDKVHQFYSDVYDVHNDLMELCNG